MLLRPTRRTLPLLGQSSRHPLSRLNATSRTGLSGGTRTSTHNLPENQTRFHGTWHYLRQGMRVADEVRTALETGRPVVALESTIYTHGAMDDDLPHALDDLVRRNGAVPATIGVFHGVPTVGLTPREIAQMVQGSWEDTHTQHTQTDTPHGESPTPSTSPSGSSHHVKPAKISRRDLAYLVAMGLTGRRRHGGTTISGTMLLAALAGIRVFGTGGLGGVHRGAELSMDISADLTELGRTRVAVVSSGCKGFLDIPRTLEFLETQGVPVATFADERVVAAQFPAFWTRESGMTSPLTLHSEEEAAAMILAQERLGVETGILFANPIPPEAAIPRDEMELVIAQALAAAEAQGMTGSNNTPFILTKIRELTDGRSVTANLALVRANVERAAKVSVALANLERRPSRESQKVAFPKRETQTESLPKSQTESQKQEHTEPPKSSVSKRRADVLVAGSVAIDLTCDYMGGYSPSQATPISPALHTSNPAYISQTVGGVGYNVAMAAHFVSKRSHVRLCSMVGDDVAGSTILARLQASGLDTTYIRQLGPEYQASTSRSAQYVAVNDANKNLVMAMADMSIFTHHSFPQFWRSAVKAARPSWLVVDANWGSGDLHAWIEAARSHVPGCRVAFEPVSAAKCARLFDPSPTQTPSQAQTPKQSQPQSQTHTSPCPPRLPVFPHHKVDLASPNTLELEAMVQAADEYGYLEGSEWYAALDALGLYGAHERLARMTAPHLVERGYVVQAMKLLPYIPTLVTKLGEDGVLLTQLLTTAEADWITHPDIAPHVLASPSSPSVTMARSSANQIIGVYVRLFPAAELVNDIVSVNGAGDTFLGVLVAGLTRGARVDQLIPLAQQASVLTLRSRETVSPDLRRLETALDAIVAS